MSEDKPAYLTAEQALNALDCRDTITNDPSASNWLKRAVVDLWDRDVVDALNDLERLPSVASHTGQQCLCYAASGLNKHVAVSATLNLCNAASGLCKYVAASQFYIILNN